MNLKTRSEISVEEALKDYRLAQRSRQMSLLARREVLNGRAKFGGFGDGKELPLLALARHFRPGDFRSGYYRDQTLLLALGDVTVEQYFAQLYAHAGHDNEPHSGGRQMPCHFGVDLLDEQGNWRDLTAQTNTAADLSPTASQMPRVVGLSQASVIYRHVAELADQKRFSNGGNEVAFGIIGNASTAEGLFWESLNALGVLQAPAVITILDDEYGISVPNKYQIAMGDLSVQLSGFARQGERGFNLYQIKGWDYTALLAAYGEAVADARAHHIPAIVHVTEVTQPQGHSTSGSHERYKSRQRLEWELDHDCLLKMRTWLQQEGLATEDELDRIEHEERSFVTAGVERAWHAYREDLGQDVAAAVAQLARVAAESSAGTEIERLIQGLERERVPRRRPIEEAVFQALRLTRHESSSARKGLQSWYKSQHERWQTLYSSHVTSQAAQSPLQVVSEPPRYPHQSEEVAGFELLNRYFHQLFADRPEVVTFGEDVGYLGGVNQTMAGMQAKFGELRVSDTGIREATIMGQAIGLALRGLRPIAEIQYLDYLPYALQLMSDDLATLHWRTAGRQKAPVIVRTRGHRLEGVWHSGSLMAGIIHMVRGMHVAVPRDMTRAIGFYNTLLAGDDPAIVVEPLLGYRQKERVPENLADLQLPLGVPEVIRSGRDVTLVTYGPLCQISLQAAATLAEHGIEVEVIDVQTLLPFDLSGVIVASLQKTNHILFLDEDVPGGTTAYMLQQVLERDGGYRWLDGDPVTLSAAEHRPAYGTDGGYYSKPNAESIFRAIYNMMHESNPTKYPEFF